MDDLNRKVTAIDSGGGGVPHHDGPISIAALLDETAMTSLQWITVTLCALVTFLDGYDMQLVSLIVPTLSQQWHIPPAGFGGVLTAGVLGISSAAAFIAPLGDKLGRRPLLIAAFLLVGLASIATAYCTTLDELLICRLATGLGLGTSLPNATALTAEFSPARWRSRLLVVMYANTGVGAIVAGFTTPALMGAFGWQSVFLLGGFMPLACCGLLFWKLSESAPFLFAKNPRHPALASILRRIRPDIQLNQLAHHEGALRKYGFKDVFSERFRAATLLLWLVYFFITFVLYVLISWLPTLLRGQGWSTPHAIMGAVTLSIGGVTAGAVQGWFADRGYAAEALLTGFVVATLALFCFSFIPPSFPNWYSAHHHGRHRHLRRCFCIVGAVGAYISFGNACHRSRICVCGRACRSSAGAAGRIAPSGAWPFRHSCSDVPHHSNDLMHDSSDWVFRALAANRRLMLAIKRY
jgi:AAHS family 4-hydroxybenzoate transporter-like MFS transporter